MRDGSVIGSSRYATPTTIIVVQPIAELTDGYAAPEDGGTMYTVCMAELARFEQDLRRHVHLEDNVLFPHAVQLETRS